MAKIESGGGGSGPHNPVGQSSNSAPTQAEIQAFKKLDVDRSGDLNRKEYRASSFDDKISYDKAADLVSKAGQTVTLTDFAKARRMASDSKPASKAGQGYGEFSYKEVRSEVAKRTPQFKQAAKNEFDKLDKDNSGDLSRKEYNQSALSKKISYDAARNIATKGGNVTQSDFLGARAVAPHVKAPAAKPEAAPKQSPVQRADTAPKAPVRANSDHKINADVKKHANSSAVSTYDASTQRAKSGEPIDIKSVKANILGTAQKMGFSSEIARAFVVDAMVENASGKGNDDPPGGKFGDGSPKRGTPSEECGPFNIGLGIYRDLAKEVGVPWNENLAKDTGQPGLEYGMRVLGAAYQTKGWEQAQILLRGGTEGLQDFQNGYRNGDRHEIKDWLPFKANLMSAYAANPGLATGTLRHREGFKAT